MGVNTLALGLSVRVIVDLTECLKDGGVGDMVSQQTKKEAKQRKERAKKAIALAMENRWSAAVSANQSILSDFPDDLEAYNRLGKALSELGRVKEARDAFQRALEISPHNTIAKKNLDRLLKMGDDTPRCNTINRKVPNAFIEESGKTGVTSLINLAESRTISKMSPGHPVNLRMDGGRLKVYDTLGEYVGQVEPRLASRLLRLIKGSNRYEATVTSAGENGLTVIIREVYKHPSQAGTVSFPSKGQPGLQVYLPSTILGHDSSDEESAETDGEVAVKDWSDDDTEPGDGEAFSPVIHRIINAGGGDASVNSEEEEY